ncbi:MAG: thiamine-phosphate kinase, partial [Candidatus Margulisbacteria bacterium]|nr:thiamine-phosphate kinase [Candidatus Margulisiibacteriota bacterium]
LSQLGEFGLIELLKKSLNKRKETIIGIGDDCAVLEGLGVRGQGLEKNLLVTTDTLVENVHFKLKKTSFYDLGYYSLFINVSDIASMGGTPTHAFVTIGAPGRTNVGSIKQLYQGISALAKKLKIDIVGGDTVSSDKLIVSITLLGKVDKKYLMTRAGAKAGDLILTTGEFGGPAAAKFENRKSKMVNRLKEGQTTAKSRLATSMIDSSDGLVRSILEICGSSNVGALIYEAEVPIAKGATLNQALHGGEEYELVFTASAKNVARIKKLLGRTKLSIVGEIMPKKSGVGLLGNHGRIAKIGSGGYEHFKG